MDYEIEKLNRVQAGEATSLLGKNGIEITVDRILSSRCLVATNENEEIIAFAQVAGQDRADVFYFIKLSKKKKTEIKASFFSVIFSKKTWESESHVKTGIAEKQRQWMFPGG
ncbi:MAG: hypothetical protein WC848_05730 [Parcubacteria group bacterium]|jgi:hypothetical protein